MIKVRVLQQAPIQVATLNEIVSAGSGLIQNTDGTLTITRQSDITTINSKVIQPYNSLGNLPITGVDNVLYLTLDTNMLYAWKTNQYVALVKVKTSELVNDSGFIDNTYHDSTKQNVIDENNKLPYTYISGTPTIPNKTSDLANDSGFITKLVNDLVNYYTKSETDALISAISKLELVVVSALPTASADTMNKIYLVPSASPQQANLKDEFVTLRNGSEGAYTYSWEQIGTTAVDLSNYYTKSQVDALIPDVSNFITKYVNDLINYTKTIDLSSVALSGNYNDLTNKPTIPSKTSDLQNDSGFVIGGKDTSGNAFTITNGYIIVPLASASDLGLVKVDTSLGLEVNQDNKLKILGAGNSAIESLNDGYHPIVPSNLKKAIMEGLGKTTATWTSQYKENARNTIGASGITRFEIYED